MSRLAVLPLENLSGASAPMSQLRAALKLALLARGVDVVGDEAVETFLTAHRIRYTGGISKADAAAAGKELGVQGVLIAAVELAAEDRLSIVARLVSADEDAAILWTGGASKVADDSPGLLGLGILHNQQQVVDVVIGRLAGSLREYLSGRGSRIAACGGGETFGPRVRYRAPLAGAGPSRTVVVLPFRNRSGNRTASEQLALEFVRHLGGRGLSVIEPGVLRDLLLRFRIIMEGGIALDDVRSILGALGADLIVTGTIFDYAESRGGAPPRINFNAMLMDARNDEILWASTSYNQGDDAVVLFDFGKLRTAQALSCRMVNNVVEGMLDKIARVPVIPAGR